MERREAPKDEEAAEDVSRETEEICPRNERLKGWMEEPA